MPEEPKPFKDTPTGQILLRPHKAVAATGRYTKDKTLQVIIWLYYGAKANPKKAFIVALILTAILATVIMNFDDFLSWIKKLTGLSQVLSGSSPAVTDTTTVLEPQ